MTSFRPLFRETQSDFNRAPISLKIGMEFIIHNSPGKIISPIVLHIVSGGQG